MNDEHSKDHLKVMGFILESIKRDFLQMDSWDVLAGIDGATNQFLNLMITSLAKHPTIDKKAYLKELKKAILNTHQLKLEIIEKLSKE